MDGFTALDRWAFRILCVYWIVISALVLVGKVQLVWH
jgi:hypothetical protein